MQRVIVYIDGFNLFYGLRDRGWRRYYWLDLCRLAENLLRPGQRLEAVRYFTARIEHDPGDPGKKSRQNTYLEALGALPNLHVHYGYFQSKTQRCRSCGQYFQTYEEKMTDVNIAVELLGDAQDDAFDAAILVSADGDLAGPLLALKKRYPAKPVRVAFPPKRNSMGLISGLGALHYRAQKIPRQPVAAANNEGRWLRARAAAPLGVRRPGRYGPPPCPPLSYRRPCGYNVAHHDTAL